MKNIRNQLDKYAELAIKTGVNLQEEQTLVIKAPITAADFVRVVVKTAYETGAGHVHVEWEDDQLRRIKVLHAPEASIESFPEWKADALAEYAKAGAAFLFVLSRNAELIKGTDPKRAGLQMKAETGLLQKVRAFTRTAKVSWAIVGVPSSDWAAKVLPDLEQEKQVEQLWEAIFRANRVDRDDPLEVWREHLAHLKRTRETLNEKK